MKPIDPRLLRHARATRLFLAAVVALGVVGAALVIAQAMLIAEVVVGGFEDGLTVSGLRTPLILLAAVALGRGLVAWLTELAAYRASAAVKSELRGRLLERAASLGPGWLSGQRTGSLVALATRGVDALDDYFARYLPQLGLAVVVPVAVLARIVTEDWVSAAIIVVTLPLIPLFMILIGWATQSRMDRQWRLLSRLSGHFLDVVAGLPTLKVFGRAKAQAESIRTITSQYRRATLRTLRIAFLSSFALELLATLSVALVAVTIGMRLVHGELDLYTGLVVLILAPEAYLPIRQVGAQYHAAAEGLSAAEEIFAVLETEPRQAGTADVPASLRLELEGVTVRHEGRTEPSLSEASLVVDEGETVALVGPSGVGKSTLLDVVLGFTAPDEGRVRIGGADLATLAPERWRERIAWVPQRPYLFAGTIAENVRLARPDADDSAVTAALRDAGAHDFVAELPDGARTLIGEDGAGLSAGQRQRLALARAFLADRPLLLLDEPTASLDGETEAGIVEAVRRLAVGRTVLLVVHRPALLSVADRVVTLEPGATARPAGADSPAAVPRPTGAPSAPAGATPEPEALRETAARSGRVLARVREAAGAQRGRLALALLLGSLALGSAVGLMAVSGWLISRASEQPPVLYLMVAVTATRAFGLGRAVFRYAERLVSHDAVLKMLAELRVAVYRGLERVAPAGLRRTRRGDLLSRLVADVDALQDYWLRWLLPAATAVVVGTAAAGFVGWLLPAAGAVLAAGLLLAGVGVPLVSSACSRHTERRLAPARADLATRITDLLGGTAELTVAGALPARAERTRDADGVLTRIAARAATATALGGGLIALVAGLTVVATALVALPAVYDGRLAGVELAVVVLTPLAAFEAVAGLPLAVQYRRRVERSAERVYEVLDAPLPVHEPESPAEAPASPFPLEVRGLSARYAGAARDALDGVDLTLTAGRRIAVVGLSGSGKTTLAQVLVRFLDARAGTYRVGGVDAGALEGDTVRRFVGLCAQDAHVFDSSIRENLRLARTGATDEELRDALGRARLLDWADALPDGLDTLVGEHGARLSGGQRQRLALARAILADFPVLVLDEPAEHLDLATADALTADLLAATEGRTTVLITHRLQGLEAVDEVLVLDGGRVVQRGPYADLAAGEGPLRRMLERERETTTRVPERAVAQAAGEAVGAPA
ncbi:thiol reductant ABC exporter subunit CydD [Streptomyces sp. NBC_00825]|uniref:thiol reductant ABC exporter subunit CydD n=1 Tax=unclassified Streptomyces TaxID=2593676 RepID=UPI002258B564|nr:MULTISPECIES: thiol reductant ABC exporter subunit CydD [unclassified Streptomyces]WTB55506.1 thiol reductant ABC exporter subunit CydD [Streptomyces sp. NBC_00826]WTH91612.1 thiol reductant ABC exporter subunit CydD [Streptomyces sp. NBC_00825]WTI00340.1 thiol reductant ABC exporter subunit CydD [Streptomyces sp. NBC_00822]MCX4865826.1 thiol reductant ABC exporter subunit CydD [Streptomyces sp. NBC_00906]MCX4897065.1 thiol reductant ABC exporter subunit CydD [Streptomyces sp. NBC_00892]